jgi:putative nucleotidyltransferase with HDIG domain
MTFLLNSLLVILTFLACYAEPIYLSFFPLKPDGVVPFSIRPQRVFQFDQEKALGGKRELAVSQYVPLYNYLPAKLLETKERMKKFEAKVAALQIGKPSGMKVFAEYMKDAHGIDLPQETLSKLLRYRDLKNLISGVETIQASIMMERIVEDPKPFKGKKAVEVLYPEPSGMVTHPVSELITLEAARASLLDKSRQLFWQVDEDILAPIVEVAGQALQANMKYDQAENDARIEEIIRRYPSKVIEYRPGMILLPVGKTLNEEDILLLAAYQEAVEKDFYGKAPWILVIALFCVILYNAFLQVTVKSEWRTEPPRRLLLSLLILTVVAVKLSLLFTNLPVYVAPFAMLPLLIIVLHNDRISAVATTLTGAILISLFSGRSLEMVLFFAFGGVAALLLPFHIRKRFHVLFPSSVVGIVNAFTVLVFSMDWGSVNVFLERLAKSGFLAQDTVFAALWRDMGWAFAGGLLSGALAVVFLPLLEAGWQTASTFKLARYADLQHPLMKDLLTKTPATYQHSMSVAYLVQAVGEAIGANVMLLRLGAYYHDIGKMAEPKFFVENQTGGRNPHEELDPRESAKIIINHVVNGETMAKEMKLPEAISDLIPQHHGTHLVEYFYNKAAKASHEAVVSVGDFRYPGPKPRSIEGAILMIADAVEAASRSLEEPSREKIEKMIRLIVMKRINDGQFDECDLSTRQLARIIETLAGALEASMHSRVAYPWQEKLKKVAAIAALKHRVKA